MTWLLITLTPFAIVGAFIVAKFCIAALSEFTRGAKIGFRAYKAQQPKAVVKARLEELQHKGEQKRSGTASRSTSIWLSKSARETRH